MLHTGMSGSNHKFEELFWSSESLKHLNNSVMYIGTCPLHLILNGFGSGITKLDFNGDSFAIDVNFFFKLSAASRANCIDIGSLTEVVSYFLLKHPSTHWATLKRVCVWLLEQFENLKRNFLESLPTTSTFKRTAKETDWYKKIVKSLKNELTVLHLSFITFIANDFLITFQLMTPRIHLLCREMVRLIRTLMSKFVKSRLLVDEIYCKTVPKSITDLSLIKVTNIKNSKPIKMIDVGIEAKSCSPYSLEILKKEKEFCQSCLKCYQVFCVNKQYWV